MARFLDLNEKARQSLTNLYKKIFSEKDKYEASIEYFEFFEKLKEENFSYYQYLVGLLYIDNYRLLAYRDKFNDLKEDEKSTLEIYQTIQSMDDLMFAIEEDQSLLHEMSFSSIKFHAFNKKGKASLMNCVDDEYALRFNKFSMFEKENLFGNHEIGDLIYEYQEEVDKETDDSKESLKAIGVDKVITTLIILFNYNMTNYQRLVLTMLSTFYKFKKYVQAHFPDYIFEVENEIIDMIENNSIEEVIYELSYDQNLLELLTEEFLSYEVESKIIDKKDVDRFFEQQISPEIKIKLKEA